VREDDCHSSCSTCIGDEDYECVECDFETAVKVREPNSTAGRCDCPAGYYYDQDASTTIDEVEDQPCSKCDLTCAKCIGPGYN